MRKAYILRFLITFATLIALMMLYCIESELKEMKKELRQLELKKDTIVVEPKFLSQSPEEGLTEALHYYGIDFKDIVYAQAVLETGNFQSKVCLEYNNLFGLYNSRKKDYYRFKHWSHSVDFYKRNIQGKMKNPMNNYYIFLEKINYAEDKNYTKNLKRIVNDKRRSIAGSTED